jgi:hypothetical protein
MSLTAVGAWLYHDTPAEFLELLAIRWVRDVMAPVVVGLGVRHRRPLPIALVALSFYFFQYERDQGNEHDVSQRILAAPATSGPDLPVPRPSLRKPSGRKAATAAGTPLPAPDPSRRPRISDGSGGSWREHLDILHERCAALDISKKDVRVCTNARQTPRSATYSGGGSRPAPTGSGSTTGAG